MEDKRIAKFEVRNLGVIKSGAFEIKPLTLFCGPNNSGKTWAMYALYGCLDHFPLDKPLLGLPTLIKALTKNGEYTWDMRTWADDNYEKIIQLIHAAGKRRLPRIFNVNEETFKQSAFEYQITKEELLHTIETKELNFSLKMGKEIEVFRIAKSENSVHAQLTLLKAGFPNLDNLISNVIVKFILNQPATRRVFLMPAERNGLHLFFRELRSRRSALLHHAGREEFDLNKLLNDVLKSKYAEPIADYIDWLDELRETGKHHSDSFHIHADSLNETLIKGKYEVDSDGLISFTPKKERGVAQNTPMSLHLTSSAIKSMFGLWFFLAHQAKPGDILMIDEPELNLHPGAQRQVARILAAVANQGVYVVVSTHSDYFVREINSLIMLSRPHSNKASLMEKFKYSANELLDKNKVAAYLFENREIKEMEINAEEGIMAATFDTVIHELNETSDSIYYAYQEESDSALETEQD
jgi:predicted ATPase